MSEFVLPIKLKNSISCVGCRFLYGGLNAECELLGAESPSICADFTEEENYKRPDNCPLQPVKPQPRCGDCVHLEIIQIKNKEIITDTIIDCSNENNNHNNLNWYCADFEAKGKE